MQQSESKMMMREGSTMDRARYSPRPTDARNDHRAGIHSSEGVEDMMELMMCKLKWRTIISVNPAREGVEYTLWYTVFMSLW